jgi:putative inorganic carbon (HCO3(-)) transporter
MLRSLYRPRLTLNLADPTLLRAATVLALALLLLRLGTMIGEGTLSPRLMLYGSFGVFLAVLSVRNPQAGVYVLVAALPWSFQVTSLDGGWYNWLTVRSDELIVVLLFGIVATALAMRLDRPPLGQHGRHLLLAMLAYIGLTAVSALWTTHPLMALEYVKIPAIGVMLYLVVTSTLRTPGQVRQAILIFFVSSVLMALFNLNLLIHVSDAAYALYTKVFSDLDSPEAQFYSYLGFLRLRGSIHPDSFGQYLAIALVLSLYLLSSRFSAGGRALAILGLGVVGTALLFTFTRQGYIDLILGATVLAALSLRRPAILGSGIAIAFVLLLAVQLPAAQGAFTRASSFTRMQPVVEGQDASTLARLKNYQESLAMIRDHPFGVGLASYQHFWPRYDLGTTPQGVVLPSAHDLYQQLASERGLLTLASFLVIPALALATLRRLLRSGDEETKGLARVLMAAIITFLIGGLFGPDLAIQSMISSLFFLVLGLTAVLARYQEESAGEAASAEAAQPPEETP